jgi:hypothetical protein
MAAGQFIANLADLILDQLIVVEEPLCSGTDAAVAIELRDARPKGLCI